MRVFEVKVAVTWALNSMHQSARSDAKGIRRSAASVVSFHQGHGVFFAG